MKNNIIIILLFGLLFSSCKREDFLDQFPKDALSEPTFFKNENDLKLYVNRFYVNLPAPLDGTGDNNSDNMVPVSRNTFLDGTFVIPTTGGGWDWTNERAVNYFLQRYQKADVAAAIKDKYAGEARLFRAFFFWQKVVRFGAVPFFSKDLNENSPELFNGRDPHKQVMDSVLLDLNYAVEKLSLPGASESGRLHKYAALALKSRICLWEGTFRKYHGLGDEQKFLEEAASAAEEIINSGAYAIYTTGNTAKDYYNLFLQEDLLGNKEAILPKVYIKDVLMHGTSRTVGQNNNGFSKNFVRSYLCLDGLPTSLSPLYKGDDTPEAESTNRDPRYAQTIATKGFVVYANPGGLNDVIDLPRVGTSATSTGYQLAKYRSSDVNQNNANQTTYDIFIFRYAEVLLNYAEAKAELGDGSQTVIDKSINKLRSRVGMPNLTVAGLVKDPASDFPMVSPIIDEIRRERRVELALEGFRFNDLLRWKAGTQINKEETILGMKFTPALKALYPANQVSSIQVDGNNYIRLYTNITSRVWNDRMYVYPIPTQELLLNPKLAPQNPNW